MNLALATRAGAEPGVRPDRFRPDIEGLRGLAVCLVVAYHAAPRRLHGGFLGVDVFFVISGYLITGLLVREIEETGSLSFAGFYARRARRLLPVSALVLLSTVLACSLFLSPIQQSRLRESASHTALYVSNFWFLRQSTDYFAPAIGNDPFLHTWSLAVEEQFYLVWPALILLALRGRSPRRTLFAVMIAIGAVSLASCVWLTRFFQPWAFFSPFTRGWEFAAGGIALLMAPWELRVPPALRSLASWLGLAAIVAAAAMLRGEAGWPSWFAVIPVLGTATILLCRVPRFGAASILELPVSQWMGRVSYSWYMWHWPVLAIVGAMHADLSFSQRLNDIVLCVVGSLGLAAATHAVVENPIRFSRYLSSRRALTLAGAVLVTVVAAGSAIVFQRAASAESVKVAEPLKAPDGPTGSCPNIGLRGTEVVECIAGNPASATNVVLFGDSHAAQWLPAFDAIAKDRGWRLVLIRKPACPTASVPIYNDALGRPYTECGTWREAAIRRIIEIRPAAVVIANRQLQNFSPGLKGMNNTWRDGSRKTLETLDSAGVRTILLRDTPSPGIDIPDCLSGDTSWWARKRALGRTPCMLNRAKALDEGVFRAEQEAAASLGRVHILDLSDLFCDGAACPPVKNGIIVYRDNSHISALFAQSLAPEISRRLIPLLPDAN
jgi:peptidoglycan/LPS O-acetylase OafA/YrhL